MLSHCSFTAGQAAKKTIIGMQYSVVAFTAGQAAKKWDEGMPTKPDVFTAGQAAKKLVSAYDGSVEAVHCRTGS